MTLTDVEVNLSTSEDFLDSETLAQVDLMQQKIQQYVQTLLIVFTSIAMNLTNLLMFM